MSQLGVELIKDATERIQVALKEDRFTKEEMELILTWFERVAEITKRTLDRGRRIDELAAEHPGKACPKCGGSMIHERLSGYRCVRNCT